MLGKLKLGISDQTDLKLFDEFDGTEYDDDECLALFDNQRVMLLCKKWTPVPSSDVSSATRGIPVTMPIASPVSSQPVSPPFASSVDKTAASSETMPCWSESWTELDECEFITSTPRSESPPQGKLLILKKET
jgi:hypothetical protein